MNFIENLKIKIGSFLLPKRHKKLTRHCSFHNFESAKSISILFDARDEKKFQQVKMYFDKLIAKGKKVIALGLIENEAVFDSFVYKEGMTFFSEQQLSWLGIPEEATVADFLAEQTDIFIDLSLNDYYHFRYVAGMSKSKMKISDNSKEGCCDLTFEISSNKKIPFMIEQINHYLEIIKKA